MAACSDRRSGRGRLFVVSGPSGVGKDAVLSRLKEAGQPYHFTVTATTRRMRPGERDGVDYLFTDPARFRGMIDSGQMLEWAEVYGNFYGIPKAQVTKVLERGQDVIVKIDVQGAATVRRLMPDAVLIFLEPPDLAALDRRLRLRNTESAEDLRVKMATAQDEIEDAGWFDYRVVNHDERLDEAAAAIERIISGVNG